MGETHRKSGFDILSLNKTKETQTKDDIGVYVTSKVCGTNLLTEVLVDVRIPFVHRIIPPLSRR